jgi:hypothetical protein
VLKKVWQKFGLIWTLWNFRNFGLGDGQRLKSQYRSYLTCTLFFTRGFNVIKLFTSMILSSFIQFHSFSRSLSKLLKIFSKILISFGLLNFRNFWTWRWPMIKKSISQLPNMHYIFYSWVQCYKTFYSHNLLMLVIN